VNDGSADERDDYNYQHFQAEGTHTGSLPKAGPSVIRNDHCEKASLRGRIIAARRRRHRVSIRDRLRYRRRLVELLKAKKPSGFVPLGR
jgi:hypothetical protein